LEFGLQSIHRKHHREGRATTLLAFSECPRAGHHHQTKNWFLGKRLRPHDEAGAGPTAMRHYPRLSHLSYPVRWETNMPRCGVC